MKAGLKRAVAAVVIAGLVVVARPARGDPATEGGLSTTTVLTTVVTVVGIVVIIVLLVKKPEKKEEPKARPAQPAPTPPPMPEAEPPPPPLPTHQPEPPPPPPPLGSRELPGEAQDAAALFLKDSSLQLAQDLAVGHGPVLEQLAGALHIPVAHRPAMLKLLHQHRSGLLELSRREGMTRARAVQFAERLTEIVRSEPVLAADLDRLVATYELD